MCSLHRRNAKRDANEAEIIDALEACGFSVEQLSKKGCGDLLLGRNERTRVVEVKGKRGKLTPDQDSWWATWQGNRRIILRSVGDALALSHGWHYMDAYLLVRMEKWRNDEA